jgi:hypothetical protein
MRPTFIIILFFFFYAIVVGQKKLTKEEIIKYWTTSGLKKSNKQSTVQIIGLDTTLYEKTLKLIDSLSSLKIGSVIIYTIAHPGLNSRDGCSGGLFPVYSFFIWKTVGQTYAQKLSGKCSSTIFKIKSAESFNYFDNNLKTITNEMFMPVIFSAEYSDNNTLTWTGSFINHEPVYSILYKVGDKFNVISFNESDLENRESLFHAYNLNLRSYSWWNVIKRDLNQ